jgi:hypothetical protein
MTPREKPAYTMTVGRSVAIAEPRRMISSKEMT